VGGEAVGGRRVCLRIRGAHPSYGRALFLLQGLANPGDNILIPKPGFSLYVTICGNKAIEPRFYDLLPDRQWEIDFAQMETLIDARTRAIILNNPSNPYAIRVVPVLLTTRMPLQSHTQSISRDAHITCLMVA
jgi:hypothetical protein